MKYDIIYPDNLEKGRYEYNILLMLKSNQLGCQWSNFLDDRINISESTLSKYTRKLINAGFIKKNSKTVKIKSSEHKKKFYMITNKGLERIKELETIDKDINYPQEKISFNTEEKILWMLSNNLFCQWRHFLERQLNISQSSLSKVLNRLIDKGFAKKLIILEKRFPVYRITTVGKKKYLEMLDSKNLDRKTILNEKIRHLREIYLKSKIFFEEYNISEENIIFQFNKYKSIIEYQLLYRNERIYNLVILFLSINHPDNYPQYLSKKDFSLEYGIAPESLEYFIKLIINKEIYPINFFVLELSEEQIYYVYEGDKKEIFLKVIIEDFLEKKFHHDLLGSKEHSLRNTFTITVNEISEIVSIIINEYKLFDKRFKTSLNKFLKNYMKHLAIKYEEEKMGKGFGSLISSFAYSILSNSEDQYFEQIDNTVKKYRTDISPIDQIEKKVDLQKILKKINVDLKSKPKNLKLKLEKGNTLRKLGFYDKAIKLYITLLKSEDPDIKNFDIYTSLALCYLGKLELGNAINSLSDGIKLYPENSELYGFKADLLSMKQEYSVALENINLAIKYKPNDLFFYKIKSEILFKMKKFDLAIETIDKSLEIDENLKGFYQLKSQIQVLEGKKKDALNSIEKEIRLDNTQFINYSIKAKILADLDDLEEALKAISEAIFLAPDNFDLYIKKAFILVNLIKNEEAIKILEKAKDLKGKPLFFKLGLSMILTMLEKYDRSLSLINEFIEEYPRYYMGYAAKSLYFLSVNSLEKALNSINKGIKIEPNNILQYKIKSHVLIKLNRLEEALHTIENTLKLTPNDETLVKIKEFILNNN